jgi:hypothetical protein
VAFITVYAIALLGFLNIACWWSAYGRCKTCRNERVPRCGCDPDNARKPWKNSGK